MKQVTLSGLVVYTGPTADARRVAANLLRQMILRSDMEPARRARAARKADAIEAGIELYHDQVSHEGTVIGIVEADMRHHVPPCGHELFADGRCRHVMCDLYYLRKDEKKARAA